MSIQDILAGIAGGLGGGFKAYHAQQDADLDEAQKAAQLKLQRDQLARAIAGDQAEVAHQKVMEQQGQEGLARQADQASFNQGQALYQQGLQAPMSQAVYDQQHPAWKTAYRALPTPADTAPPTLMDMQGQLKPGGQIGTAAPWQAPNTYGRVDSQTEKMQLGLMANDAKRLALAGTATNNNNDNATALEIARMRGETAAAIAAAKGNQGIKLRPVSGVDARRIAEYNSSLGNLGDLVTVLGDVQTGATSKLGTMMPDFVTQYAGWGRDAKKGQAVLDLVKQKIGKALEGGVLRKEDEAKYTKILAEIGNDPAVAMSKIKFLDRDLQAGMGDYLNSLEDSYYDVSKHRARFENRFHPKALPQSAGDAMAPGGGDPAVRAAIAGAGAPAPGGVTITGVTRIN